MTFRQSTPHLVTVLVSLKCISTKLVPLFLHPKKCEISYGQLEKDKVSHRSCKYWKAMSCLCALTGKYGGT